MARNINPDDTEACEKLQDGCNSMPTGYAEFLMNKRSPGERVPEPEPWTIKNDWGPGAGSWRWCRRGTGPGIISTMEKPEHDFRKEFREEFLALTEEESAAQLPQDYFKHHHWVLSGVFNNLDGTESSWALKLVIQLIQLSLEDKTPTAYQWHIMSEEVAKANKNIVGFDRKIRWREVVALQWAEKVATDIIPYALAHEKKRVLELLIENAHTCERLR